MQADGRVEAAGEDEAPSLVVTAKPEAPAALLRGEEHLLRAIEVSGDSRFADAVLHLVRHLRWDFEDDLARLVGDIAAYRIAEGLRGLFAWQRDTARRLAESATAYVADERGLVVRRAEHEHFAAEVARLRDAVERLEQRVRLLGPAA
ncbi:MAG TPA: hypothetical protein VK043_12510 [Burkholderiales bacterium]|nr:hypothetical protein [Burkholderiales bacterium]